MSSLIHPVTDQEKACFEVLQVLDHVGGHVKGSLTSKKYMRNEIWSLISFLGAPSWFITLSPADNRHPICLYFADTGETFSPEIRGSSERNRLIASNPIAAARFFDLMVRSFIKNVLGMAQDHAGLYGKTSGYYGTVEQQGRLTLHLHLLLWIKGALSPQEIRDRLMSGDSEFQRELTEYLESVHQGDFMTGDIESVRASVPVIPEHKGGIHAMHPKEWPGALPIGDYKDPTMTLPVPPPPRCTGCELDRCDTCRKTKSWWRFFRKTVDDLVLKSNVHHCTVSRGAEATADPELLDSGDPSSSKAKRVSSKGPKGCLDSQGNCRARFPCEQHETTHEDPADGHVNMKKRERFLNTFTPCVTYLLRCNTDITSLLSGTSIKAIVSYITDYVTKPTLKTYQIFASMYDVFEKHTSSTNPRDKEDSARRLILKIVNSLSSKLEIGSPMAAMYLLGNPDHYTGHEFISFWWKTYVNDVKRFWAASKASTAAQSKDVAGGPSQDTASESLPLANQADIPPDMDEQRAETLEHVEGPGLDTDHVLFGREDNAYVATSKADDYKFRPAMYESMSLYEWIQTSDWRRATKKEMESIQNGSYRSGRSTYLLYEEGYSLRSSRLVRCVPERKSLVVLNIVGGALPRHDQGDREHYCCTMLTLFKNWHTGGCLKRDGESWDNAFRMHQFAENQIRLMKNFNLRYECLDAHDDFHAQLKSKSNSRGDWIDHGDTDEEQDGNYISEIREYDDYEHAGRIYLSNQNMISAANRFLSVCGWLGKPVGELAPLCERLVPPAAPSGGWSNFVKKCKDAIFKQRFENYVPPESIPESNDISSPNKPDIVRVLSSDYFNRDFRAAQERSNLIINETASAFSLNAEQLRAFRLIANHGSSVALDQLLMYLGGMGGTGKSQVIKSLMHLFKERNESYRFMVLAPTGTAAALLNGSTYHKALAVNRQNEVGEDFSKSTSTIVNEVRERFQGVDYVFVDEVSMISCSDLYTISTRLAQVTGVHDVPFGGKNVIVASDFAQLAPVFGSPLYDGLVEKYLDVGMSAKKEQSVIGKMIWHQFTTVVILKQNMRQLTQTEDDSKLHTCLENMRYAACTPDDIAFLRTCIAGKGEGSPNLGDVQFRNVSIITARNNQKDAMNEEGAKRFAADYGLQLEHFYSVDARAGSSDDVRTKGRRRKKTRGSADTLSSGISQKDQEALWECSPHMSGGVAAKLSLCVGMPVIIRNNEATELCITKGQEAIVVGWDAGPAPYGRQTLNTLYVRLENPPKEVKVGELPLNVVPLTRTTSTEPCILKSDQP